jgi:type IV secretory pathway VirB2 component (pilin)
VSTSSATTFSPAGSSYQRTAGTIGLWAGLLGAASGILLMAYPAAVSDDRFSYPFTASGFTLIQSFFFVQHLGIAVLIAALWTSGAAGRGGIGRLGVGGSVLWMLGLAVTELVAISAKDSPYPSPRTDTIEALYGATSTGIAVFLIIAGIAVLRARQWTGWQRWLPLALGVYVFVPLTPGLFGPFWLGRLVITVWMLLFALLGWTVVRSRS